MFRAPVFFVRYFAQAFRCFSNAVPLCTPQNHSALIRAEKPAMIVMIAMKISHKTGGRPIPVAIIGALILVFIQIQPGAALGAADTAIPEEIDRFLKQTNDAIAKRDNNALRPLFGSSQDRPDPAPNIERLFEYLPKGAFIRYELARTKKTWFKLTNQTALTVYTAEYQYEFEDGWAYITIDVRSHDTETNLYRLNAVLLPQSLKVTNAFTLTDKSSRHFLFLGLAILVPCFILFTLIVCVRARHLRFRIPWMIFMLFGVGSISFDWTTGAIVLNPYMLLIFGAGLSIGGDFLPVVFKLSFPLGAALFWYLRQTGNLSFKPDNGIENKVSN